MIVIEIARPAPVQHTALIVIIKLLNTLIIQFILTNNYVYFTLHPGLLSSDSDRDCSTCSSTTYSSDSDRETSPKLKVNPRSPGRALPPKGSPVSADEAPNITQQAVSESPAQEEKGNKGKRGCSIK